MSSTTRQPRGSPPRRQQAFHVGTLATPGVVANLLGVELATVLEGVRAGRVRTERIRGTIYVCLEDVEASAGL